MDSPTHPAQNDIPIGKSERTSSAVHGQPLGTPLAGLRGVPVAGSKASTQSQSTNATQAERIPGMLAERLTYIAKSHVPSTHANSIQVVNMICALAQFTKHLDVYIPWHYLRMLKLWSGILFQGYGRTIPANAHIHFLRRRRGHEHGFEAAVLAKKYTKSLMYTRSSIVAAGLIRRGEQVLYESHDAVRDAARHDLPALCAQIAQSPSSGVIAISPPIAAAYSAAGLPPERILIAPDGVDLQPFVQALPGALGRLFGASIYDRPVLLYTGSLGREKGAAFLAQAAAALPEYNTVIVGGCPQQVRALQKLQPKRNNLFIHPGVEYRHIPSLLQDASVLVMPYLRKGLNIGHMSPLKLFEYLASGRPILSADLPVLRTILQDGRNALLFEPESVPALRAQLLRLDTLDQATRDALREQQLHDAERYSWHNRCATITAWHGNLCKRSQI